MKVTTTLKVGDIVQVQGLHFPQEVVGLSHDKQRPAAWVKLYNRPADDNRPPYLVRVTRLQKLEV